MGLRKQLREDGHLTAGACGFTTWNGTVDCLSDAYVKREMRHIMAVSEEAGGESEEGFIDTPHGDVSVCYAFPSAEEPIRDAMSGQPLH